MATAITSSETASILIQSFKSTSAPPSAPAVLPPARLAEAIAILAIDLVGALGVTDQSETLERLANRLHERGRTPRGTEAAQMLDAIGGALLRLGC